MKKSISIVLLATILLQSCVVNQKTSISLKEAYDNKSKVKVTTTQKDKFHFHQILLKDSIYYGAKSNSVIYYDAKSGEQTYSYLKAIPLDTAIISGVYEKNTKKSTWRTVFMTLGLIVLSFGILIGIELALYRPFGV